VVATAAVPQTMRATGHGPGEREQTRVGVWAASGWGGGREGYDRWLVGLEGFGCGSVRRESTDTASGTFLVMKLLGSLGSASHTHTSLTHSLTHSLSVVSARRLKGSQVIRTVDSEGNSTVASARVLASGQPLDPLRLLFVIHPSLPSLRPPALPPSLPPSLLSLPPSLLSLPPSLLSLPPSFLSLPASFLSLPPSLSLTLSLPLSLLFFFLSFLYFTLSFPFPSSRCRWLSS
jgi:hypothetical protein